MVTLVAPPSSPLLRRVLAACAPIVQMRVAAGMDAM